MDEDQLKKKLSSLPLGGIHYFDSIGSTNDDALVWASQGAPDLSLVVSEEQISGRGRLGRKWHTPPGSALALSLILRPSISELEHPALITGLAALALVDALRTFNIISQIKWPNDILLNGRKVAGILVESNWLGDDLNASILGVGVNVLKGSLPFANDMAYPATSIEDEIGYPLDRIELLSLILSTLIKWRNKLALPEFIRAWEENLAFHGEQVTVSNDSKLQITGDLLGLGPNGILKVRTIEGVTHEIPFGEIHLRPVL